MRLLSSLPACTQRSICHGAALASRLDPLGFSDDECGRSKALFFAVLNVTSMTDPELVNFSCDPENWAYGQTTSEETAKEIISAHISFPARAALVALPDWLPACVAHGLCNPEDPDALGYDSSFFAVTQQQRCACVRECYVANWLANCHPPRWIPDCLAKDEARDTFIGETDAPLNGFGRAHVPCCPRLRRMILGKSETVQITIRDTRDCFFHV